MADIDRKSFPVPPKRPTVLRPDTNGPSLPARPAPPVPGGRPSLPTQGRTTDGAPVLPKRPSAATAPQRTNGMPQSQPAPLTKPPERPLSTASGSVRKRPEITIVSARPMSEVGFRSEKAAVSPSPALSGKTPEVPGKPPPPRPKNVSPSPETRKPYTAESENLLIDFDTECAPPPNEPSQSVPKPSCARPPPPKPTPARLPPTVPQKEEADPSHSQDVSAAFKTPPSPAKRPGVPPTAPRLLPSENADNVSKPPRAQPPKVPSKSCDNLMPSNTSSTSDLNDPEQRIHGDLIQKGSETNDAHNQINTPSHVLVNTGDEYAVVNKPKRPTIIRPGRPAVKDPTDDSDIPKAARNPPSPSPRMARKETDISTDLAKTVIKPDEENNTGSTPEFLKLRLKPTVELSGGSDKADLDINNIGDKSGKAPPPVLAPKPKPGVMPKPQVSAKPKLNQAPVSTQHVEPRDQIIADRSEKMSDDRTTNNLDERQSNMQNDMDVTNLKPTSVKRPTIIRPAKSQSVEKLSSSESLNSEDKTKESLKQDSRGFTQDDSDLRPKPRSQPQLPSKRPVSMINIPKTLEQDLNKISALNAINLAAGDAGNKPKPVPRPVARARPMSMAVPSGKHNTDHEENSDLPLRPQHRPDGHETKKKVPLGVAVLPQPDRSPNMSPPKPVGRPPPPKVSPKAENHVSDDETKLSPQGPPKPGRPSIRPPAPKNSPKVVDTSSSDEEGSALSQGPPKPDRPSTRPPLPKVSPRSEIKDGNSSEEEFHSVTQEPLRPPPPALRQSPQAEKPQRPSGAPPRKASMKDEISTDNVQMRPPKPDTRPSRPLSTPGQLSASPGPKPARPTSMAVKKTGVPELPKRPGPGHPLYHHMMQAAHGIALHDFTASQHDELSFKAGEVIVLLKKIDTDWLMGQIGEREGMFPRSFIKVKIPLPGEAPDEDSDSQSDTEEMFYDASSEKPDLIGHGPRCRARFDFDGEGPDDLVFEDGDVIKLLERVGPEWRKGELNGKTGLFPLSFVEVIEDLPADGATEKSKVVKAMFDYEGQDDELSFQRGDLITVQYKVNDEWLYGECGGRKGQFPVPFVDHMPANLPPLPAQEATTLKDPLADADALWGKEDEDRSPQPISPKQPEKVPLSPTQSQDVSPSSTPSKDVPYCIAVYDFPGEAEGDLGFVTGDKIELLEHIGTDWLRGSLRGNTGMFPAAFVEIHRDITVSDPKIEASKEEQEEKVVYGIAQFDFHGETEKELTFEAGTRLKLLETVDGAEDWQWGELDGHRGMFPAAFVKPES